MRLIFAACCTGNFSPSCNGQDGSWRSGTTATAFDFAVSRIDAATKTRDLVIRHWRGDSAGRAEPAGNGVDGEQQRRRTGGVALLAQRPPFARRGRSRISAFTSNFTVPSESPSLRYSRHMATPGTPHRQLGPSGPQVFPIALGCMGMSGMYGPADERESIATIHAALEYGITLLDTGDFYGAGHNEMLIGRALRDRREQALLSVKFGALRGPDASWLGVDARPAAVKNFLTYSLTRLGVDHVDIYRPARLDPQVPVEETIGAIADLIKAGYVRSVGLSEVGPDTIRRAHAVHPVVDLQIEYSLVSRAPEEKIFPVLGELGIGVTAYGVLSRGLLSGSKPAAK